jgi:hypothetical protein
VIRARQRAITQFHGPAYQPAKENPGSYAELPPRRADSRLACAHEADCRLLDANDLESTGITRL